MWGDYFGAFMTRRLIELQFGARGRASDGACAAI
jgi:hypothetical protein